MRLLFVINDVSNVGGTERVTTHIANLMVAQGFTVDILSIYQHSAETFFTIDPAIKQLSLYPHAISLIKSLIPASIKLKKIAKNYDIVVFSDTQLSLLSSLVALTTKTKVVAWEHFNSSIVTRFGSRWFGRRLAAWLSDLVIVLTEQDKNNWHKKYCLKNPIKVIANPSAIQAKIAPITELRSNTVVSVGRYTEQKGFDLLVQSWAAIDKNTRAGWQLKIIGPNGSAKPALQAQIKSLGLNDVILDGPCNNMAAVYNNADIYVMSSRYEGFGLTLIEAMSSALPVIAFDCPMGPGEIIAKQYGLIVPAEHIQELSEALSKLLLDTDLRHTLSNKSLIRAQDFSEQHIANIWQQTLNKLL
ncbi:MAG: glycosyltransferase family 4 protein [Thalassotalea sp.]